MSVNRFMFAQVVEGYKAWNEMRPSKDGEWVRHDDYADLEAELKALRDANGHGLSMYAMLKVKYANLEHEVERMREQEPVAVFKGAHDGRFVIDWLHGYIPPVNLALYTAPVPPASQSAAQPDTCSWEEDDDGCYSTACGHRFTFNEGGPADNGQKFCGYCGGTIDEHNYNDMPEGE